MHRIAKFHFVSPGQFLTAMQEGYPQYTEAQIKEMYENLKLFYYGNDSILFSGAAQESCKKE